MPGYFAADGDAANSSADCGRKWRAHLSPDKPGRWTYHVSFVQGKHAALDPSATGKPLAPYDGKTGSFQIAATDNADALASNDKNDSSRYCLAKPGSVYLVYLPAGGAAEIDLSGMSETFTVEWFDPRHVGPLRAGSVPKVSGGGKVALGTPPRNPTGDWLAVITRKLR